MSYPGGKNGAGIPQRLINMIPPHETLISPFAGRCGVVRNIKPAERTVVVDVSPAVCEWWDETHNRAIWPLQVEIYQCCGIGWLAHYLGHYAKHRHRQGPIARPDAFLFCDPPYVLSERTGRQYEQELTDEDHRRLAAILLAAPSSVSWMLCG